MSDGAPRLRMHERVPLTVLPVVGLCGVLWLITVRLNWPGHYSVDSIVQLAEGMTGFYVSFNPPGMSIVLGEVSRWGGHGAFMALSAGLYFTALARLLLRGWPGLRRGWPMLLLATCIALSPVTLIYNGTVWKDVFCANLLLLAFVLVPAPRALRPWPAIASAILLAAVAARVREHGAIAAMVLIAYAAWTLDPRTGRWPVRGRRVLQLGGLWLGLTLALGGLIASQVVEAPASGKGWRIAMRFEIAGMVFHSRHPEAVLTRFGIDPDAAMKAVHEAYTPQRVDTLGAFTATLNRTKPALLPLWWALLREEPLSLWRHKTAAAGELLGRRTDSRCLPAHVGVSVEAMDILRRNMPYDFPPGFLPIRSVYTQQLYNYRQWGLAAFTGWPYALLLVAALSLGLQRRNALASSLALAGLLYVASFVVAGLACDFRYQYFGVAASLFAGLALCQRRPTPAVAVPEVRQPPAGITP